MHSVTSNAVAEKINETQTEKKFIVIICGYSSINKTLEEASVEDESVATLDELINNCNNLFMELKTYL